MRRVLGLEALGRPLERSAVTIGKFFAVHRGHQALLRATVAAAAETGGPSVVLTFDRHPRELLQPGWEAPVMASLEERLDLIEAEGVDVAVVAAVTPQFLKLEPEAFVEDLLIGQLGAGRVLAGDNFRFGHRARGDVALLKSMGPRLGFEYTSVPPVMEGGHRISSSRVAACIESGQVSAAAILLGRPYSVSGIVVGGEQLGRKLGFPTANVTVDPKRLLPADGVYVVEAGRDGETHAGVANLGVRPTVDGRKRLLEVHLLNWTGDLYGSSLTVRFLQRLRQEQRFPDLEALKRQIAADVRAASEWFSASGPGSP